MLPVYVKKAIDVLQKNGFEAFAVGGCVRDMLRGVEPNDYDITTSAMPEQIKKCFKDFRCIETGIKHGTVGVLIEGNLLEITTYRIDGKYLDNRRPDSVEFTTNLKEDLKRRDFTINAMTYSGEGEVGDFFGGRADLEAGIIRCVGKAEKRFEEDALRILRALRFAARFGFEIEKETKNAIFKKKKLLLNIAPERIREEFCGIITADYAADILLEFYRVFEIFIPEISKMRGVNQYNDTHAYDVFMHTIKAVEFSRNDLSIRLCMLFHDIGKPYCFSKDENGKGHFYGHQKLGANISKEILKRLRFDNKTIDRVFILATHHDGQILAEEKSVRRWLRRLGHENLKYLLEVKKADALAHKEDFAIKRIAEIEKIRQVLDDVLAKKLCYNLKMLDFTGRDALEIGLDGNDIGECLEYLLTAVIENRCKNEKDALLKLAAKYKERHEKKINDEKI